MSATEPAPWSIVREDSADPRRTQAHPGRPWSVLHPEMHAVRARKVTRFATQAEALAFVLAQPEVRRRTSTGQAHQQIAEALS